MAKAVYKPKDEQSDPLKDFESQLNERIAEIKKIAAKELELGITTNQALYKNKIEHLNKAIETEKAIYKTLDDSREESFKNARAESLNELHDKQERLEKNILKEIADQELTDVRKIVDFEAKLRKKLTHEATINRLKDEIQNIQSISAKQEKEREKELKSLEARKEILIAQNQQEASRKKILEQEKAIVDARKNSDKKAEELAKKRKKQAEDELKESKKKEKEKKKEQKDQHTSKDGAQKGLENLFSDFIKQQEEGTAAEEAARKNTEQLFKGFGKALSEGLNEINNAISSYAKVQTAINSRLNGSEYSGYSQIAKSLGDIAYSPLLRAEDLYNNVAEIVGQGIAVNIEQRAMFATVKDGIAATFDVTADSLKRIIRLQQNDSTAARLGLEAYLNEFLNVYTKNTEYLQDTFDNVASSLLEASALIKQLDKDNGVAKSLEFEFQVQKWLGTLTGYGFSTEASQNIANAIGQLATGDVDSLISSDINNLMLMAANKGGASYAEILSAGATAEDINNLMYGLVSYMQEIAENDNNIIKNQLAKTFGVGISDLIAATNIGVGVLEDIRKESLSYSDMYGELQESFDALPSRLGIANRLENAFANFKYQTGANIASNPIMYATWKITDMINSVTGGINIPHITAMGSGIGFEATVENLIKLGLVGISTLGGIGDIASGIATATNGSMLLDKTKVSMAGATIKQIEGGLGKTNNSGKRSSGDASSEAAAVGNSDGQTYADSAVNDASDEAEKELEKKEEEFEDPVVVYLDEEVELIDKLETIISLLGSISGSAAASAKASNAQSAAAQAAMDAAKQASNNASKDKPDDAANDKDNSGTSITNNSFDITVVGGISKDDLNSGLDKIIVAIEELNSDITAVLQSELIKGNQELTQVNTTLSSIATTNDGILKLIPTLVIDTPIENNIPDTFQINDVASILNEIKDINNELLLKIPSTSANEKPNYQISVINQNAIGVNLDVSVDNESPVLHSIDDNLLKIIQLVDSAEAKSDSLLNSVNNTSLAAYNQSVAQTNATQTYNEALSNKSEFKNYTDILTQQSNSVESIISDYSVNIISAMSESISSNIKEDNRGTISEILSESNTSIKSVLTDSISNINVECAIPKGEISILVNRELGTDIDYDFSNIVTRSDINLSDLFVNSDLFASEFKSIAANVAKIAEKRQEKDWRNPTSSHTSGSAGSIPSYPEPDTGIDGLTQHNTGQNPLFF